MNILTQIYLLFVRNLKKSLGAPMWLVLGMMQPVLYLLLYMPLLRNFGGTELLPLGVIAQMFVPGMLVIMGVSTLFVGFGFIPEIREGFITRLLVTPVSRWAILLGMVFTNMLTLLCQSTLLLIIAFLLGLRVPFLSIVLTLVLVLLVGMTMSSLSYIISIATRSEDGLASLVNTLYLPIMLLSGIMLPIALAPEWLKTAARFNPFYYAVEASRALFQGDYGNTVVYEGFIIMGVFAVVVTFIAARSFKKMTA